MIAIPLHHAHHACIPDNVPPTTAEWIALGIFAAVVIGVVITLIIDLRKIGRF